MKSMTFPTVEGAYLRDLLEQADALARTFATDLPAQLLNLCERVRNEKSPYVILTGMGSSFHALNPLAIRLAESGIRTLMLETSELIYYWKNLLAGDALLVAVSQSGRSAEILRLLKLSAGSSPMIAITNDPTSPLAHAAVATVLLNAGQEASVSCKTYVSTLLSLDRLGDVLCSGISPSELAASDHLLLNGVRGYLSNWQHHVEEAQDCLLGTRHLVLAGRGDSLASTGTGGLIIKEAARFPAEGMSSAAFRHGPLEMVSDDLAVLVFEGDERSSIHNRKLVEDVLAIGGRSHLISKRSSLDLFKLPHVSDRHRPIVEILPVQMISLALATREGREAGTFAHATKITTVE